MTIRPVAAPAAGRVAGAGRCHVAQRGEDLHVWLLPDKIVGLARSARAGMCNPCGFQLYLSGVGAGCPSRVFPLIAGFTCQCLADRRGQRLLWHRTVTFAGRRKKSHLRQGWQVQKKCFAQKKKEKMGKHRREGHSHPLNFCAHWLQPPKAEGTNLPLYFPAVASAPGTPPRVVWRLLFTAKEPPHFREGFFTLWT